MGRRLPPSPALVAASTWMSEMAATQGGVVTAAQCRAVGIDDPAVRRLLAAGLWPRARRGIYADAAFVPWVPEPTRSATDGRVVGDPAHHAQCAALLASLAPRSVRPLAGRPGAPRRRPAPQRRAPARATAPTLAPRPARLYHPPSPGTHQRPPAGRRARRRLRRRGRRRHRRGAGARRRAPGARLLRSADTELGTRRRRRGAGPRTHHPCRAADRTAPAVHPTARR